MIARLLEIEVVGQRTLAVTANTDSHVLTDEAEVDYEGVPQ